MSGLELNESQIGSMGSALAAGLWCAATNSTPINTVWSSGVWPEDLPDVRRKRGFARVGLKTLRAKVELAHEFGAQQLFVPEQQIDEAEERLPPASSLKIGKLSREKTFLDEAMGEFLVALKVEPPASAPFHQRRQHYFQLHRFVGRAAAERFSWKAMLSEVIADASQAYEKVMARASKRPKFLVTVLSGSHELVAQTAGILKVERCLVLVSDEPKYNERKAAVTTMLNREFDRLGLQCELLFGAINYGTRLESDIQRELSPFLDTTPPGEMAFDLTPATKLHGEELRRVFARDDDWIVYNVHRVNEEYKAVVPRSQRLMIWQAGAKPDLTQFPILESDES